MYETINDVFQNSSSAERLYNSHVLLGLFILKHVEAFTASNLITTKVPLLNKEIDKI